MGTAVTDMVAMEVAMGVMEVMEATEVMVIIITMGNNQEELGRIKIN